jgi:hypothetical protein
MVVGRNANMRHIPQAALLEALRQSLRDLENLTLLSPEDLQIIEARRNLKAEIASMEEQQGQSDDMAA